jgi:hypothetical protein
MIAQTDEALRADIAALSRELVHGLDYLRRRDDDWRSVWLRPNLGSFLVALGAVIAALLGGVTVTNYAVARIENATISKVGQIVNQTISDRLPSEVTSFILDQKRQMDIRIADMSGKIDDLTKEKTRLQQEDAILSAKLKETMATHQAP